MKLSLPTKSLANAMETLRPLFRARTQLPVTNCVHLDVSHGHLHLRATNLEAEITTLVEVEVESDDPHEICASGSMLERVAQTNAEFCKLELKDATLHFSAGQNKAKIPTLEAKEFPAQSHSDTKIFYTGPTKSLTTALKICGKSSSFSDNRPFTQGVGVSGIQTTVIGCNPYMTLWTEFEGPAQHEIIIPHAILPPIIAAMGEVDTCKWSLVLHEGEPRKLIVDCGKTVISTSLIQGKVPYSMVARFWPTEASSIKCNRSELKDALKFVRGITEDGYTNKIKLNADGENLSITATGKDGLLTTSIEAQGKTNVALNADYFIDMIGIGDSDDVELLCTDGVVAVESDGFRVVQQLMRA